MDLLVDARVLLDDNMFNVPHLTMDFGGVDPKDPRAEIMINPQTREL